MFPIVFALVVLVAAGAAALAGLGAATGSSRPTRAVGLGLGATTGIGLIVVAGLVGTLVMLGIARSPDDDGTQTPPESDAPTSPTVGGSAPPTPGLGPEVRLVNVVDSDVRTRFPATPTVVDRLEPATVLQVVVEGFPAFAEAVAEQCVAGATTTCANRVPVQFGADGRARFQYLAASELAGAPCSTTTTPCTFVVRDRATPARATVQTVFGASVPPAGRLEVTPRTSLRDGQPVRVELEGLPPGARAVVTTCAAPATIGERRCGAPAPTSPVEIGADGSASVEVTVTRGPVGDRRITCDEDQACGIALVSDVAAVRAAVAPISFAAAPGATYDPSRLVAGLVLAASLLAGAAWLIVRTDWAPVGEAAAPEIDQAQYADLDAIVDALPAEPEDALDARS